MFANLKLYAYIGIALVVAALSAGCWFLWKQNQNLIAEKAKVEQIALDKQAAAQACTDSIEKLKKASDEATERAKAATEEAKKEAAKDYKSATDILIRKPKPHVEGNAKFYGGTDQRERENDYLNTHDLFNDLIDQRKAK